MSLFYIDVLFFAGINLFSLVFRAVKSGSPFAALGFYALNQRF